MKALVLITELMVSVLAAYYSLILLCDLIGLFCKKKKYPQADPSDIAVMVCARNEENVIGNLLDSLRSQTYPADKMKIFVVAHNCTDETARIAREKGAIVFERNEPSETFKGDALSYGVKKLKSLYPNEFDILCVFDADNVVGRCFLEEINAAIHSGADVVQGFRHSKNYHKSTVSEMFGAYWLQIMLSQNLPHTAMGLPATIGGTGFAVRADALGDGWKTCTMLEDIEFTCQMVLAGKKCILAPHAVFYDEQPTTNRIGLRQRYRWAVGGYQVMRRYLPRLFRAIPERGISAVKMLLDIVINPVMLISFLGMILRGIISYLTGGFAGLGQYVLGITAFLWLSVLPATAVMLFRERMDPFKNRRTILFFPFFLLISMLFAVPALFDRNLKWKPIPHTDNTTIDSLENPE